MILYPSRRSWKGFLLCGGRGRHFSDMRSTVIPSPPANMDTGVMAMVVMDATAMAATDVKSTAMTNIGTVQLRPEVWQRLQRKG